MQEGGKVERRSHENFRYSIFVFSNILKGLILLSKVWKDLVSHDCPLP